MYNKNNFTDHNINIDGNSFTHVFIDTSSLLHNRALEGVMKNQLIDILDQSKARLTVPKIVIKELEKFANENSEKAYSAKRALENVHALCAAGYIYIDYHNGHYVCADKYFLEEALTAHSKRQRTLFITQDYNLFKDLTAIGRISSVGNGNGGYINIKKINIRTATLENFSSCYSKYNNRSDIAVALKRFGL